MPVLNRWTPSWIRELTNDRFWRKPVALTFHGRDILAPVAAQWSLGTNPTEFGPTAERESLVPLHLVRPHRNGNVLVGRVEFADSFGNLITNLSDSDLVGTGVQISIAGRIIRGLVRCYADQPIGIVLALIGSSGRLEVAVNGGSRCKRAGRANPGTEDSCRAWRARDVSPLGAFACP